MAAIDRLAVRVWETSPSSGPMPLVHKLIGLVYDLVQGDRADRCG